MSMPTTTGANLFWKWKPNKDGREYDIVLSYPDLKIIKEQLDR